MIQTSATVERGVTLGRGVSVWDHACIREDARLGRNVTVGQRAYVGVAVSIGDNTKIQNNALIYEPATIEKGVFIGPGVILTNDRNPRAVNVDNSQKTRADWTAVGVHVLDGASVGAGAVCVAPITIGRWSMVAAGSVVIRDVPDFALVAGNPSRRVGWVGRAGERLVRDDPDSTFWRCPVTDDLFGETDAGLLEIVENGK